MPAFAVIAGWRKMMHASHRERGTTIVATARYRRFPMKKYLLALWPITKAVVIAPLPYTLSAVVVSNGVVFLYWLFSGWAPPPDWFRVGNEILVMTAQCAALVPYLFRQWRAASEEFEKVIESRNRIRKLQDEL